MNENANAPLKSPADAIERNKVIGVDPKTFMCDGKVVGLEKFKDISELEPRLPHLDGRKFRMQDIIGRNILVSAYLILDGKYSTRHCVQFQYLILDDNTLGVTFSGSKVILDQLERNKCNLPFVANIKKRDNKYLKFEGAEESD